MDSIPDINKDTPESAYDMMSDTYDSIDEFCEAFYELPASDIKVIYSLHDGDNEDEGFITNDGTCYIAYSGFGVHKVTEDELYNHFAHSYDDESEYKD